MTYERMQQIHKLAMTSWGEYQKHMTAREIDEVNMFWDQQVSGHSSFASSFMIMMAQAKPAKDLTK